MVTAIVQARMGSSRLPGKVLADLAGQPLLQRILERVGRARRLERIVVATSTSPADDPIVALCDRLGVGVTRGSEADVLDRYYQTATAIGADPIVRLTADCPLIDPAVIDLVVSAFCRGSFDYASNIEPPTYPDGLDVEVVSYAALARAWREATLPSDREHVTLYIRRATDRFVTANITHGSDLSHHRWVVDEAGDLRIVREIYAALGTGAFGLDEVVALLERRPELTRANAGVERNAGLQQSLRRDAGQATGPALYERAKRLIPGGTQLLSKRPEMFLPGQWPSYYSQARGAEVWDLDGRRYLDMSYAALGSCVLGYADSDVDAAVHRAIDRGTMSTLNCPEEVELAELLVDLHPWAEMARFTRGGGEAMAVAIRTARAATGRDVVAFCGYHGWHDWYLAANLGAETGLDGHLLPGLLPAGVPRGLRDTVLPFEFGRLDQLERIVRDHGSTLAAVVLEPARQRQPPPGFLEAVKSLTARTGAVLVFDEITSGFRLTTGGAHLVFGVSPDVAVFAKAMGNGYPIAAVIGVRAVMEAAQSTFMSSTFWTDRVGPVAALATIHKHRDRNVADHLQAVGRAVQAGWCEAAARHGLGIDVGGIAPLGHLAFTGVDPQAVRTLYTQLMLERGILASSGFYAMLAHQEPQVDAFLHAVDDVFRALAGAVADGSVEQQLKGPVAHSGFRRLA